MRTKVLVLLVCVYFLSGVLTHGQSINVSHPSGVYDKPFYLRVDSDAELRFTIDGNTPDLSSAVYVDSIPIGFSYPPMKYSLIPTNNIIYDPKVWPNWEFGWRAPDEEVDRLSVIRIKTFNENTSTADSLTLVYKIGDTELLLPIVSLVADSMDLFSYDSGIYVAGRKFDEDEPETTGNYYGREKNWERPGHICYFDPSGEVAFNQNIGIRIHGGYTRPHPQKTLRIYARSEYGKERISYPVFGAEGPSRFKRLLVRSGMVHWFHRNTVFQDEFLHELIGRHYPNTDYQRNQPVFVYINGEFWGLSNMRERQDEYYLGDHYDIEEEDVEIVEPTWEENNDFHDLLEFCQANNLKNRLNYQRVLARIDLDNFIRYTLFELFVINQDWPHNNYKIWRSELNGIPWKWMFYDFDACLRNPDETSVDKLLESDTPHGILFKALCENTYFVESFLAEWEIMRETLFNPVNLGDLLDKYFLEYNEAIPAQIARWWSPEDMGQWHSSVNQMMLFLLERPATFEQELKDIFAFEKGDGNPDFKMEDFCKIYPNPVVDDLHIEFLSLVQANWFAEILDMNGKVVVSKDIGRDQDIRISLGHLASGVYLLRLRSSNYQYSFLVRKH